MVVIGMLVVIACAQRQTRHVFPSTKQYALPPRVNCYFDGVPREGENGRNEAVRMSRSLVRCVALKDEIRGAARIPLHSAIALDFSTAPL